MKTALILIGVAILCAIIFSVIRFFNRLGKPVNKALSDSYYYHARKDIIVYSPMGNWFELDYVETTADRETFQVLSRDFGKDRKAVFWKGKPQTVDYSSFIIDSNGVAKDIKQVYYTPWIGKDLKLIVGADPKTFQPYKLPSETYNQNWSRDDQSVFLYGNKIDVDGKTFKRINQSLGYDSLHFYAIVYQSGLAEENTRIVKKVKQTAGQTEAINDFYARIGNSIIHSNWKNEFSSIEFESIDTIKAIDERNIIVDQTLVSDGKRLDELNVATLEIVGRDYLKDNAQVYFDAEKIEGADPETFSYIFENYSKDAKHVYYKTDILSGIDPQKVSVNYSENTITDGKVKIKNGVPVK